MICRQYIRPSLLGIALISLFSSFTTDGDRQVVSNEYYSFTLPMSWEPVPKGTSGNIPDMRPVQVTTYLCDLYSLQWSTKVQSTEEFYNSIWLLVRSYRRRDGKAIVFDDVVSREKYAAFHPESVTILSRKEERINANQIKLTFASSAIEMGVKREHMEICLFIYANDMVHCLIIGTSLKRYVSPETKKVIQEILASFKVK
jgi:hypothetical protein